MLRGSEDLKKVCKRMIGEESHVTADGKFSWIEVECLGACVNAPMVQINADYYEDLTPETFTRILNDLSAGHAEARSADRSPIVGADWRGTQTTLIYEDRQAPAPRPSSADATDPKHG